mgnify:CR=1 FL=1
MKVCRLWPLQQMVTTVVRSQGNDFVEVQEENGAAATGVCFPAIIRMGFSRAHGAMTSITSSGSYPLEPGTME